MEFKIISGPFTNCEKSLNLWNKTHKIKVIAMTSAGPANVTILTLMELIKEPNQKTIFDEN